MHIIKLSLASLTLLGGLAATPQIASARPKTGQSAPTAPAADPSVTRTGAGPVKRRGHTSAPLTSGAKVPVTATPMVGHPKKNHGIYVGHRGVLTADVKVEDFIGGDFTLSTWWMPHFPYSRTGPLFSNEGSGNLFIGQLDYRKGDGGYKDSGRPVFLIKVGTVAAVYLLSKDDYAAGQWAHVAVIKKNGVFSLYVNGEHQQPVNIAKGGAITAGTEVQVGSSYASKPTGKLQLGRGSGSAKWQAYGVMDEVGLFDAALGTSEVATIASTHRFYGNEPHLKRAWTFDKPESGKTLALRLNGQWSKNNRVYHVPLSNDRRSSRDDDLLDNPFFIGETHVPLVLPFKVDEVWRVTQGMNDPAGSHNGNAAFCWDFVLAQGSGNTKYPGGSELAPVYAAAPGKLVAYSREDPVVGPREASKLRLSIGGGDTLLYLHLEADTLTDKADGGVTTTDEWSRIPEADRPSIAAGEYMAKLGPKAEHLHLDVGDSNGTLPGAFTNYWVSEDQGATWSKVFRGFPKKGQWIKRTE